MYQFQSELIEVIMRLPMGAHLNFTLLGTGMIDTPSRGKPSHNCIVFFIYRAVLKEAVLRTNLNLGLSTMLLLYQIIRQLVQPTEFHHIFGLGGHFIMSCHLERL